MIYLAKMNNQLTNLIFHLKIKIIKENKWYFKTVFLNMIFPITILKMNIKSKKIIWLRLYNLRN